jgi:hypothetical protein
MRRLLSMVSLVLATGLVAAASAGATVDPLVTVTGPSPFPPGCNPDTSGTNYPSAEVEPYVASNPANRQQLIGVWQQDRWSNGGSNGLLTATSTNGGGSWTQATAPPFTHCQGGDATNGGDYDHASDPWVTTGPTGVSWQIGLGISNDETTSAVLVSQSTNHGETWGPITTLRRDSDPHFLNDKESITADSLDANRAYAVWDRLDVKNPTDPNSDFRGPTWFSRTTNGGASWTKARKIFDPGLNNQTIGNQIVELPNGDLLDVFDLILQGNTFVADMRSTNHGRSWSKPTIVDREASVGVYDPMDFAPVRTGDIIPEVATDPRSGTSNVYLVWQDARFSGGHADQVVFSHSSDGGQTWSPTARISSNPNTQAFTPMVTAGPNGNVAVTYYDFTNDSSAAGSTLDTDYWITRSTDGGATFHSRERITTTSFDMRTAPDAGGFFVGDYEGLTPSAEFTPFFVAANSGNTANRTDVFATSDHAPFPMTASAASRKRAHRAAAAAAPTRTPGHLAAGARPVMVH